MPDKLIPRLLIITILLDIVLSVHAVFELKRYLALPDPGGFNELAVLLVSPLYILSFIILLVLSIQTVFTLIRYKNQKTEGEIIKIQKKVFILFIFSCAYLAVASYIFLQSFLDIFNKILNEHLFEYGYHYNVIFQISVLAISCAIVIFGFYKAIKKFHKSKLFWFIIALLFFFITFIVIPAFFMPPAGKITRPDGTTEIIYYLPNGTTSTKPF